MKLYTFTFAILLISVISCAPTSTPQQPVALATSAPQIVTPTLLPTNTATSVPTQTNTPTPTETSTPTATSTEAPRPTNTPTLVPSPTSNPTKPPTPIKIFNPEATYPKIIWQTDFSNGAEGHAKPYNAIEPGHFEYVEYPSRSGNKVLLTAIDSSSVPQVENGVPKYRLYPAINQFKNAPLQPPYYISMKANMSGLSPVDMQNLYIWNRGSGISILDLL